MVKYNKLCWIIIKIQPKDTFSIIYCKTVVSSQLLGYIVFWDCSRVNIASLRQLIYQLFVLVITTKMATSPAPHAALSAKKGRLDQGLVSSTSSSHKKYVIHVLVEVCVHATYVMIPIFSCTYVGACEEMGSKSGGPHRA